jgi:hypothetical protein
MIRTIKLVGVAHPAMHRSIPSPGCKRERSSDRRGIEASPKGARVVWEEESRLLSGCHGPSLTLYPVGRPLRLDRVVLGVGRCYCDSVTSMACMRESQRAGNRVGLTDIAEGSF